MKNFYVIEGVHKDPNQIDTLSNETKKKYGPFEEQEANQIAKGLIQKNIDNAKPTPNINYFFNLVR